MTEKDATLPYSDAKLAKYVVDDSHMDTQHPDIFNITNTREEVTLCFGTVRSVDSTANALSALLSSRIILSPYTAKRIAILLAKKIAEYEAAHGSVTGESAPSLTGAPESILYVGDPDGGDQSGAEQAIRLMRLIEGLNTDYAHERSYKLSRGSILQNRFLFGISKSALKDPEPAVLAICQQLNMPPHFLTHCRELLPMSKCVHFGFEENQGGRLYKVYLEFDINLKFGPVGTQTMTDPFLLHLGFKWSADDNTTCALSRYTCYPFLSNEGIIERIGQIFSEPRHEQALRFAAQIMGTAADRMPEHKFLYIEVSEEGNPRLSFDIKLYEANLLMGEITPLMTDILKYYDIPGDRFAAVNTPIRDKAFGHLSGGIDRHGEDFLTLYYGVQWR